MLNFLNSAERKCGMSSPATKAFSRIGDLIIGFRAGQPSTGRIPSTEWTKVAASLDWQLWQQPQSLSWKGIPLTRITTPGWHIQFLGELYGQRSVASAAYQVLSEIARGECDATGLNGHFLLWIWDESRRQWHIWTDRFGTLHAYHARHGDAAALGTCFRTVAQLASGRKLDWAGLTGFFGFGFFPADRTFFEDVRILRPATHYVFDAEGVELSAERYWNWNHEPDRSRSYEDTVAGFADIFGKVTGDLVSAGRIAIPISGGLDSRCTVAAVRNGTTAHGLRTTDSLWAYSYGYSADSIETRIARQVAEARGLPFKAFTIKPYLFDRLEHVVAVVEGFTDVIQSRQAAVVDELRQNADYVIAAHWGDVWLDDMGLASPSENPELRIPNSELVVDHALKKMAKKGRTWLLENICAPHFGKDEPEGLLRQFVKEGMAPLQQIEDPDFRVKAFKTGNWSFRGTLPSIRMFQAAAFPRLPFYDTRLTDFFSSVPSAFVQGRRLQVDYLKRFAPDLARVKWQPYDADLYRYRRFHTWHLSKRALKKAWRILAGLTVIERNWEVQFGGEKGEAGLRHWLLRPGLRLHDLVSKQKIVGLLNDFKAEPLKEDRGYTVSMLLTLSVWLESNL